MTLHCDTCDQTILRTDTVCWHCGKELTSVNEAAATGESTTLKENKPISITAVSIFTLITLLTILLFIIVTNALSHYPVG